MSTEEFTRNTKLPHLRLSVRRLLRLILIAATTVSLSAFAQEIPRTGGETLSGKHMVLADELRGHAAVLVAGFSREGGNGTGAWVKAIRADTALAGMPVYEIAQIAGAPGIIRGVIKSGMRKSVPDAEHDSFVVLTQDDQPWRTYFGVGDDKVPYVMVIDVTGKVLWRGHGSATDLEPNLRDALKKGVSLKF
jgi:hypothetical protein